MSAGGSLEAWIVSERRKAEEHERKAEEHQRKAHALREGVARKESGLLAERAVGRELDPLGQRGWRVLHDRAVPGSTANIDHLLVGPPGVVVVDAKAHSGRVTIGANGVRVDRWSFGGEVDKLRRYGRTVRASSAGRAPIHHVICFAGDVGLSEPDVWEETTLLELRHLNAWLLSLSPVLTARQAWELAELLEQTHPDRLAPALPVPISDRDALPRLVPAPAHLRPERPVRPSQGVAQPPAAGHSNRRRSTWTPQARRLVALLALLVGLGTAQFFNDESFGFEPNRQQQTSLLPVP